MIENKTLGQELLSIVDEALKNPKSCKIVRPKIDVVKIRKNLKLTQKQFAKKYHINIETLRNWEQGKRIPDGTSIAYLTCINKTPDIIDNVLNG